METRRHARALMLQTAGKVSYQLDSKERLRRSFFLELRTMLPASG